PSSAGLLFPSGLCLHVGLFLADLGALGPAPLPDSAGRFRASRLSLPRASSHLGKARSASLVAQHRALASRRAMVPGRPDRPSGSELVGLPGRTWGPCRSCRSAIAPSAALSE